ncbi:MAG: NUDIX hydrolase [Candidatus Woesebacteria bacterium GW2011_GWA1_33_30]|uniref:NUDIX hydrolase n=1 Tax=Candidatus Woesebacteria bacterium GW2011_GWA2_33_28 TaxID=1618561 RepID=A0A0G0C980_9BACT|nr:MAG: NUDIX hydrolase [Candidatus Woesebacteria bacterium GW2011_GWA2_33_28]KKP48597.1 MAG: NUDIX hydrolase [Candidatus Woesebacteria bacterium GW2011_GWA1_33_30]KKP49736.1 MAG: NUDIX hydrolase [Microgenomates group bacterium GW2011_GWC1_33_32]KKP52353.1 MAG: NUDIX hydrolase [Candidatus Woesebacteria bacterium GW2011_GWB1_33_38]KKP57046.1 MAG: NUDIX hydrolase [Microgenomates group bacterium GW2011_GWD1_33_9]
MNISWTKIKEERYKARAGYRKLITKTFDYPNGHKAEYDILDDNGAVCVLVLTPKSDVIMVKVYRPGPEKVLMEMPGGFIDIHEDPQTAVERELIEETGYEGEIEFVGKTYDDAYSNMVRYCYISRNSKKIKEPNWDDDEGSMEIVKISLSEFRKHLKTGEMTDVEVGYLCLDYLNLL